MQYIISKRVKFRHAILGGTFDHFHSGHAHFIDQACLNSEKITIGLTISKLSEHKLFAQSIEYYETRHNKLQNYLIKKRYSKRTKIIPINDFYGTTLKDATIDAIFVTEYKSEVAKIINKGREEIGFPALKIVIINPLLASDGKIISSSRIRAGEIDRDGNSYLKIFKYTLVLPENLRTKTKITPQGKLVKTLDELGNIVRGSKFIIAVGDVVSQNLIELKRQADVSVIDYKVGRKSVRYKILKQTLKAKNEPGTINSDAVRVLKKAIGRALRGDKEIVKVSGEEDLFGLPATLLAPLDSVILYGMPASDRHPRRGGPGKGIIAVQVTEEKKAEVKKLLEKFDHKD